MDMGDDTETVMTFTCSMDDIESGSMTMYSNDDLAAHVQDELHVYGECSNCGIGEWVGEELNLTIETADDEPTEGTFCSRQCLINWLTADERGQA